MPFDTEGALKAGATEDQVIQHLGSTRKFDVEGALKAGASKRQIIDHMAQMSTAGQFETKLQPDEEKTFQTWKTANAPNDSGADYDLRGAFKAGVSRSAGNGHFPDTFKKPNHPTFSSESKYATPDAPHWDGNRLIDKTGKVVADETPAPTPLKEGTINPEDTLVPAANKWLKENHPKVYSALESFMTIPDRGVEQLTRGATQPGISKSQRVSDVIEGASTLASPVLLATGPGQVGKLAKGAVAATIAKPAVEEGSKAMGADEDTSRAAGDVAGVVAALAAPGSGARAARVASSLKRGAGSVVSAAGNVLENPAAREAIGMAFPRVKQGLNLGVRLKGALETFNGKKSSDSTDPTQALLDSVRKTAKQPETLYKPREITPTTHSAPPAEAPPAEAPAPEVAPPVGKLQGSPHREDAASIKSKLNALEEHVQAEKAKKTKLNAFQERVQAEKLQQAERQKTLAELTPVEPANKSTGPRSNLVTLPSPEPAIPSAAYEAAARSDKAQALAKTLHDFEISHADAKTMDAADWAQAAKGARVNPPSQATIEQALTHLRRLEKVTPIAEELANEFRKKQ